MRVLLVETKWYRGAPAIVQNPAKRISRQLARCRDRWGLMPDPIQSIASSSYQPLEGASAEENSGQVCLSPAAPNASVSETKVPADAPAAPPAVTSLVVRFSPPTGSHLPIEPSLGEAVTNCSWEVANASIAVATALAAAPIGPLATLLTGARGVIGLGTAERCIERDEARQVAEGEKAKQSADCERDGAMPLLKPNGAVICAWP
jgi:hypothetical protein